MVRVLDVRLRLSFRDEKYRVTIQRFSGIAEFIVQAEDASLGEAMMRAGEEYHRLYERDALNVVQIEAKEVE